MRPSFPVEGGCPCGAVRYRLLEDPLELHVCHCMDCQRASGSAFVMTMSAPQQALEVVQGRLETVSYETVEGIPRCDERCAVCYARLWSQNTRYPEIVAIRPGTFDDTSWLEPIAHLMDDLRSTVRSDLERRASLRSEPNRRSRSRSGVEENGIPFMTRGGFTSNVGASGRAAFKEYVGMNQSH